MQLVNPDIVQNRELLSAQSYINSITPIVNETVLEGRTEHEIEYNHNNFNIAFDHSQAVHAPSNATTLSEVKTDADVSSAISNKHTHANKSIIDSIQEALTTTLKNNYDYAYSHSQASHAPVDAQKNSDITKAEIEAKLTGEISSHSHAGGGGGLTQSQILARQL